MWMTSKFESYCGECESPIFAGDRMVYDHTRPYGKRAYCANCGIDVDGPDVKEKKVSLTPSSHVKRSKPDTSGPKCADCQHPHESHNLRGCEMCPCLRKFRATTGGVYEQKST